jgi:hypothetical protein
MQRLLEYPTTVQLSPELDVVLKSEYVVSTAAKPGTALLLVRQGTIFEPVCVVPDLFVLFCSRASDDTENTF